MKTEKPPKDEPLHIPDNPALNDAISITRSKASRPGAAGGPDPIGADTPETGTSPASGWPFDALRVPKDDKEAGTLRLPKRAGALNDALALLRKTPSGKRLLALATRENIRYEADGRLRGGPIVFDPEARKLRYDAARCNDAEHWNVTDLAALLVHELQHAAQAADGLAPGRKKLEYESHAVAQIFLSEAAEQDKGPRPMNVWLHDEREAWARGFAELENLVRARYGEEAPESENMAFYREHLTAPAKECRQGGKPSRPIRCFYSNDELNAVDDRYAAFKKAIELRERKGGR